MKYFIGIDGGGTKTDGIIIQENGQVLAHQSGGAANMQTVGVERACDEIKSVVEGLAAKAGLNGENDVTLFAGLAGAGRPEDQKALVARLAEVIAAAKISVNSDAIAALYGAFPSGTGIILIAGTGSICYGKDRWDRHYRTGGWGFLLGDEGSGYFLGQQAIIAALKSVDGRGKATVLRQRIETAFSLESIEKIISPLYSGQISRTDVAALAPVVFDAARNGDHAALHIIEKAGHDLGELIAGLARQARIERQQVTVALIGSIFQQREMLIPYMQEAAEKVVAGVAFVEPRCSPVVGAVLLAMRSEKIKITAALLNRIGSTL
jgi:N-acetylglucosamine kinase-like BadF-type ATPase